MKSQFRSLLLRVSVSLAAIAGIVFSQREHLSETWKILSSGVAWGHFACAVLLYLAAHIVLSMRIYFVFHSQEVYLRLRDTIYLTFMGLFFNLFLPSAVGGDIAKGYYATQHSGKKIESMTAIIWDRLLGFATLMGMGALTITFFGPAVGLEDPRITHIIYAFGGVFVVVLLFFLNSHWAKKVSFLFHCLPDKIRGTLKDLYWSLNNAKRHKSILLPTLGLSILGQVIFVMVYYEVARSLGADLNPWLFFIAVPAISIVSMAPSLGGLGVREAGVVYFFKSFIPDERALALSLLLDMLIYGICLSSGLIYAIRGGLKTKSIPSLED